MVLYQPAFVPVLIYIERSKPDGILQMDDSYHALLKTAMRLLQLTPRAYQCTLKVSPTIADLAGSAVITVVHLAEALQYCPKLELM
jgi:magnesium chelatase family protein